MIRIFQNNVSFPDTELDSEASHYIRNVIHIKEGATIILCDLSGNEYISSVKSISRSSVVVKPGSSQPNKANPKRDVWLLMATLKGRKIDDVISNSTALGISKIIPFIASRSINKEIPGKTERWKKIALEASRQCGRSIIPEITNTFSNLEKSIQHLSGLENYSKAIKLFCWEETGKPLNSIESWQLNNFPIILTIGPEGGFTKEEAELAKKNGFEHISLGPRIFRANLAPVVALSIIMNLIGEFDNA